MFSQSTSHVLTSHVVTSHQSCRHESWPARRAAGRASRRWLRKDALRPLALERLGRLHQLGTQTTETLNICPRVRRRGYLALTRAAPTSSALAAAVRGVRLRPHRPPRTALAPSRGAHFALRRRRRRLVFCCAPSYCCWVSTQWPVAPLPPPALADKIGSGAWRLAVAPPVSLSSLLLKPGPLHSVAGSQSHTAQSHGIHP